MTKIRVNGKIINIDSVTVRQACREALALEPSAKYAEVLSKTKQVLTRFTRAEAGKLTMQPAVSGSEVNFRDRRQDVTIHCDGEVHARQIAHALAAGAISFAVRSHREVHPMTRICESLTPRSKR